MWLAASSTISLLSAMPRSSHPVLQGHDEHPGSLSFWFLVLTFVRSREMCGVWRDVMDKYGHRVRQLWQAFC